MYKILIKLIKINKYIYQYCIGFIILKTDLKKSIEKLIIFFSSLVNLCIDFFLLLLFIKKKNTINLKKNKIFDECYKKFFHEKSKILILDIGAHRGESILRFKELFKNSKIISFEPNPNAIESIKEKIKLYDLDKIFYNQKVIGPKNKVVNFFIYKKEDTSSVLELDKNSRFYKIRANEYSNNKNFEKKKIEVDQITLDNFVKKGVIKNIDIIKIDVQGYEIEVLKGMKNLINKKLFNFIEIEFMFKGPYKRNEKSFSDLETLLGKAYSILAMNEIKGSQNDDLFVDILFKKNL